MLALAISVGVPFLGSSGTAPTVNPLTVDQTDITVDSTVITADATIE